jgi:hypothetical protein
MANGVVDLEQPQETKVMSANYIPLPYRNVSYKNKTLCSVISIPPSCCIGLNVYYGGREIY